MQAQGSFGRTIQLFLVDGKPTGLRKATIHGWTGLFFVSGAFAFGDLTARDEVDRTGIYILSGPDPEKTGATRTYIGSGNSVAERTPLCHGSCPLLYFSSISQVGGIGQ